jgi:hypothetical protein
MKPSPDAPTPPRRHFAACEDCEHQCGPRGFCFFDVLYGTVNPPLTDTERTAFNATFGAGTV